MTASGHFLASKKKKQLYFCQSLPREKEQSLDLNTDLFLNHAPTRPWEVSKYGTSQSLYQMVDLQWQVAHHHKHPILVGGTQPLALDLTELKSTSWPELCSLEPVRTSLDLFPSTTLSGLAASDQVPSSSSHFLKPSGTLSPLAYLLWSTHPVRTNSSS